MLNFNYIYIICIIKTIIKIYILIKIQNKKLNNIKKEKKKDNIKEYDFKKNLKKKKKILLW